MAFFHLQHLSVAIVLTLVSKIQINYRHQATPELHLCGLFCLFVFWSRAVKNGHVLAGARFSMTRHGSTMQIVSGSRSKGPRRADGESSDLWAKPIT